jgi:hypothetical protein
MRFKVLMLAFSCAFLLIACTEQTIGPKLYDQSGLIEVESQVELEQAIHTISRATKAPIRDTAQDLDQLPMYLLSNEEINILVQHKFGETCDWKTSCEWEYSLAATDVFLDQMAQKRVVDRSYALVSRLDFNSAD